MDGHRQAEDGQVLPGEEEEEELLVSERRVGGWGEPERLKTFCHLLETDAFVFLTAGSLHVQTNLPDAEEDRLGQQVAAGRRHSQLRPPSPLRVCCASAQCCFQVPGAAHRSAPAQQQRGTLWPAVPRGGPLHGRAGGGGVRRGAELLLGCFPGADVCVCVLMDVPLVSEAHCGAEPGLHRAVLQNSGQNQRVSPPSTCVGKTWIRAASCTEA